MDDKCTAYLQHFIDLTSKQLSIDIQLLTPGIQAVSVPSKILSLFYRSLPEEERREMQERFLIVFKQTAKDSPTHFYEICPGLKVAITPIPLSEPLYMVSGFFLGISDRDVLKKSLTQSSNLELTELLMEQCPVLDEMNRDWYTDELNRLQHHIIKFMEYEQAYQHHRSREEVFKKIRMVFSESYGFEEKFGKIAAQLQSITPFQVMGIATASSNHKFKMNYLYGTNHKLWEDVEFNVGEGFFGWALLMQKPEQWGDVTEDPRYFSLRHICDSLRSLSIFPLVYKHEKIGLLFFASTEVNRFGDEWIPFIQSIESAFSYEMLLQSLDTKLEYMSKKMTILMGISQLLTTNLEQKRILNVVVDFLMSIGGVNKSFGVLLSENREQVQYLVGRGMSVEEIKGNVINFIENDTKEVMTDQQMVFPVQIDNRTIGWFFIGSKDKINRKDVVFTNTMVSVASSVLRGWLISEQLGGDFPIDVILRLIQFKDIKIYEQAHRITEWIELACSQMGIDASTKRLTIQAARLRGIGILVTNEELPLVNTVEMDTSYVGARLLEAIPSLSHLALIVEAQHEHFNGMGPLGQLGDEIPLPARILHTVVHFDNQMVKSNFANDQVFTIIDEMEKQSGQQFDPVVLNSFLNVMRRRFSVESSNLQLHKIANTAKNNSPFEMLSPREFEVLSLIAKGHSNKEIAGILYISEHTVKNHISNIFQKLNVSDRTSLVSLAYQHQLIQ